MRTIGERFATWGAGIAATLATGQAVAQEAAAAAAPAVDSGDTAWVMISAALVLLMTPGLAFFYGGMARTKNVTSTLFQSFSALAVVGILWFVAGYSLVFSGNVGGFIGNLDWFMLSGVDQSANGTIPHLTFMIFQCMFAIITPALITGALAERLSFKGWLAFAAAWSMIVYVPVAHWVWGPGGWIGALGGLDFAGGLVVHMTAGFSALVAAVMLGKRRDFGSEVRPYDAGYVMLGTALLWFGWFGFNAGSALGANGLAAHAFATTFIAAAAAGAAWTLVDNFTKGKPSAVGACIGVVVGLVAITPGAGFVSIGSALFIGAFAGAVCNFLAAFVKEKMRIDDSLDVFACHGMGGLIGSLLTPVFASSAVNAAAPDGLIYGNFAPFKANLIGSVAVVAYAAIATYVIIKAVSVVASMRVKDNDEEVGLDMSQHGEVINSNFAGSSEHSHKKAA